MPSEEQTYREGIAEKIDNLQNVLELRMNTFEQDARNSLARIETKQDALDKNQKFTNGKLRKMIIAMVFLGGIVIGQTFGNLHDIIQVIAGAL